MVQASSTARTRVAEVVLSGADREYARRAVDEMVTAYTRFDDLALLRQVGGWGYKLPGVVRDALLDMRYGETAAALVVRNGPVDPDVGPTPRHWRDSGDTLAHDMWLLLIAAQLGDPVSWSVWQDGRLINDVLPVAGEEEAQTGLGSEAELAYHVEEALYDDRCDSLALYCLRNEGGIPTTVATADCLDLSTLDVEVLLQPRYVIGGGDASRVRPALFGSPESPYLRVDPPYMAALPGDDRAAAAFADLCGRLRDGMVDVILDAGDLMLIDNYRAVHGRRPFRARHDGTDRWLRRCTTTKDMRATRSLRDTVESRVITPDI